MLELAKAYDICHVDKPKLTIVFLHGIAADSSSFDGLIKYLSKNNYYKDVRLVAFDWLGSGKSYTSDELNYDFKEQLGALHQSVAKLNAEKIVIVAHSMGTMLATRFADQYPELVQGLILISAPVYLEEDIKNPMFKKAMDGFREVVGRKSKGLLKSKAFNNEIEYIVSDVKNYDFLLKVKKTTIIIYGELDRIIAAYNIPALVGANSYISAVKTAGPHGVTMDKYSKIDKAIKSFQKED